MDVNNSYIFKSVLNADVMKEIGYYFPNPYDEERENGDDRLYDYMDKKYEIYKSEKLQEISRLQKFRYSVDLESVFDIYEDIQDLYYDINSVSYTELMRKFPKLELS
tara:strand:+ start:941 stop:1261 length:321 start_codon:yes stop_codon:yes gene_type:complete